MRRRIPGRGTLLAGTLALLSLTCAAQAHGLSLEPVALAGTYSRPIFVTSDPTDEDRLFVIEQVGRIKLTTPGGTTTFLDQTAITDSSNERGLLSMAFAPDFATSHRFYIVYAIQDPNSSSPTVLGDDGDLQLDELVADGDVADEDSRRHVKTIEHSARSNHNGGQLQFGPDGYLYWSIGDGGANGAPAQDPNSLLGKLLRIDPRQSGADPYTVPADNPFVGPATGADEIWSLGLRNPWRFSFDRATGALTIGDVGQGAWEEVDYEPASAGGGRGDNFGWDCREGAHNSTFIAECAARTLTEPAFEYSSLDGSGSCAITGGYVARDPGIPELAGRYVYSDLCEGQIRSLTLSPPPPTQNDTDEDPLNDSDVRLEGLPVGNPSSFGEDACGRLYVASLATNVVSRIVGDAPTDCDAPDTIIDSGPPAAINDPTPTFTFHSTEPSSTFECSMAAGPFSACGSPHTVAHLDDGPHTFSVRAIDATGNVDPTPVPYPFSLETAEVKTQGDTLVVTAAPGASDDLVITRPDASTLRVMDMPGGPYDGSGIHAGAGCTRHGDYTADCDAAGIDSLRVLSRNRADRIVNVTDLASTLNGGVGSDVLVGGPAGDTLVGGAEADTLRGLNGSDVLLARDLTTDTLISCDGGTVPGTADRAKLDALPDDPASVVRGCETTSR